MQLRASQVKILSAILSLFLRPANEVWGKVIFCTCLSFCSQGGVPGQVHPPDQVHPRPGTPPGPGTLPPGQVNPLDQVHPPDQVHPQTRYTPQDQVHPWTPRPGTPPQSSACWEIRATSSRYAAYWNAFLSRFVDTLLPPANEAVGMLSVHRV